MHRRDQYILNDSGEAVECNDLMKWGRWMQDLKNLIVANTKIVQDVRVSTMFIGLDHNLSDEGPPILWETRVFRGKMDEYMERYSSRTDAEEGHLLIVEMVEQAESQALIE